MTANFTAANVAAVRARIAGALRNVATAMRNAGYADAQWTLLVQTYPSPIPRGSGIRYSRERLQPAEHRRLRLLEQRTPTGPTTPPCPTINGAVTGAAADSGLTNVRTLDLSAAFNGRRLCENTVGLYEEKGIASWLTPGAVDQTEWVNQIRTVSTCCGSAAPTTSRSRCTRTTGPSSPPAAACARPGTAAARAAAPAASPAPGSSTASR